MKESDHEKNRDLIQQMIARANQGDATEDNPSQPEEPEKISIGVYARRKRLERQNKKFLQSQPLGREIVDLFKSVVILPEDFQYELIAAYACVPSSLADVLPILYVQGESGSGKSQISKCFAPIVRQRMVSGTSTAASLKNEINALKFADPESCKQERNFHLILENANRQLFEEEQTLNVLLNGYDRESDLTLISNGKGGNIQFFPFGPKLITTVTEISNPEIWRRVLLIRTRKPKKSQLEGIKRIKTLPLQAVGSALKAFWEDPDNWDLFIDRKSQLDEITSPELGEEKRNLVDDLIVSGVIAGVWDSFDQPLKQFVLFFQNQERLGQSNLLVALIEKALVLGCGGIPRNKWQEMSSSKILLTCHPIEVKKEIDIAIDSGIPIRKPSPEQVQEILKKLGWYPRRTDRGMEYVYRASE